MLHSSTSFGPGTLRDLAAAHVSRLVMVPGIVTAASKPKHKATRIVLQCKVCRNTRGVPIAPGLGGAHVPRYCDGGGGGGAAGEGERGGEGERAREREKGEDERTRERRKAAAGGKTLVVFSPLTQQKKTPAFPLGNDKITLPIDSKATPSPAEAPRSLGAPTARAAAASTRSRSSRAAPRSSTSRPSSSRRGPRTSPRGTCRGRCSPSSTAGSWARSPPGRA